ncbi:MAG: ShlB/FhaC/HecB family hemolysin secretion/activation protein [Burkholderiaceae bacterium]|nr:ShlB/FhaC/HecB family hemolysin secretion/activation protein [Burkholderiaceae bacterium]
MGVCWAQAPATASPQQPAAEASGGAAAEPTFDVLEYDVEGNTVLPAVEIERAVYPYLGEHRTIRDVEGARKALEDAYQSAGYQTVFVDIPEQKINSGVVRLHVLEGRVERTRVAGARYYLQGEIRAKVTELTPGTVPDFSQMQQQLASVNKQPDRQVAPILKPGRAPGTVDVDLSVKDRLPLHIDLEYDNHNSPFTSSNRANASIRYDNLWQAQHSLSFNYQVAPEHPSEARVYDATYLWRFSSIDDVISLYAIKSDSNVAVLGSTTILGNGRIEGIRWIRPVLGSTVSTGLFNLVTVGFDRKYFPQTNISAGTGSVTVYPNISYAVLTAGFSSNWNHESGTAEFSLTGSSAPRDVFGNSDDEFKGRRVTGSAGYLAWKLGASAEQFAGGHVSMYALIDGQITADPLIPNEQYPAGGADSVRGYKEAEITGDRGWRGTLELRAYPIGRPGLDGKRTLYVLVFTDAAALRLIDPLGPQIHATGLASAGFGLRALDWYGFRLDVDVARALRNGGQGVSAPITKRGADHFDFSIGWSY